MDARSYTVGAKLADGPFGALHEGVHPQTQARVLLRILPAALNKDGKALSRLKGLKKSVQRFLTGQSQGDPSAAPDPVLPMLLEYGNLPGGLVFWPASCGKESRWSSSGDGRWVYRCRTKRCGSVVSWRHV